MIKAASEQCHILPQIQEIPFLLHFLESQHLPMTTENSISDPLYFFPHCCENAHDDSIEYSHLHQASLKDPLALSGQGHPIQ